MRPRASISGRGTCPVPPWSSGPTSCASGLLSSGARSRSPSGRSRSPRRRAREPRSRHRRVASLHPRRPRPAARRRPPVQHRLLVRSVRRDHHAAGAAMNAMASLVGAVPRTRVASLRDRGELQPDDVLITRPGPWGNPFTLSKHGWSAVDHYRSALRRSLKERPRSDFAEATRGLAGRRLLCACPPDTLACHGWILAEEVERLTGVPVEPAPGRERR